jgi:hypothetical protein
MAPDVSRLTVGLVPSLSVLLPRTAVTMFRLRTFRPGLPLVTDPSKAFQLSRPRLEPASR